MRNFIKALWEKHLTPFRKAFCFLEDDNLWLLDPVSQTSFAMKMPEDKGKLQDFFDRFSIQYVHLLIEMSDQVLVFDLCPQGFVWADRLRFLRAIHKKTKKNHMFWRFVPASFALQESLTFGLSFSGTVKGLLEILAANAIQLKVYSLSLELAAYTRFCRQQEGDVFAKRTLTLIIQPCKGTIRHFLFWGKRLIFMRLLRRNSRESQVSDPQVLVTEGEETLTYVRKQRRLKAEPVFWVFLTNEHDRTEWRESFAHFWRQKKWHLGRGLRVNRKLCQLRFSRISVLLKVYGILAMGLLWGGLNLYQVTCIYALEQRVKATDTQTFLLEQQRSTVLKKFEKIPGVSPGTGVLLQPFLAEKPPPLTFLDKISSHLPVSVQLRNFEWKALLQGRHELTFDIDTKPREREEEGIIFSSENFLESLQRELKVIEILY